MLFHCLDRSERQIWIERLDGLTHAGDDALRFDGRANDQRHLLFIDLSKREPDKGLGRFTEADVFSVTRHTDDLVERRIRSTEAHPLPDRIGVRPQSSRRCFIDYRDLWITRSVAFPKIAPTE